MKKILAFAIIVLAVFSCLSVASAGLFDALGGQSQAKNQTYTFDGFTLSLPDNAKIEHDTIIDDDVTFNDYGVKYNTSNKNSTYLFVETANGSGMVKSVDQYKNNWLSKGAKDGGKYGEWTIIDINGVQSKSGNETLAAYMLVQYVDSKMIIMEGKDLAELKKVADTYKKT